MTKNTCSKCRFEWRDLGGRPSTQRRALCACDCRDGQPGGFWEMPWGREAGSCSEFKTRREPVQVDEAKALAIADKAFEGISYGSPDDRAYEAVIKFLWPEEE